MKHLESLSLSTSKHCDYYRQKIAELSPAKSNRDQRMIYLYRRLLIRDSSLLHNLELLRLSETMHLNTRHKLSAAETSEIDAPSSLNLSELRHLLEQSRETVCS